MSLASKAFKSFFRPQFNKGSLIVRYLAGLQQNPSAPCILSSEASEIREFRTQHGLSAEQFFGLSDFLGSSLAVSQALSGSSAAEYQTHLDYKLREIGFSSGEDIEATWENLNSTYKGIHELNTPSTTRVEILKELGRVFVREGKLSGAIHTVGTSTVDSVISNLENYKQTLIQESEDETVIKTYEQVFDLIETEFSNNPTVFMIDVVTWIHSELIVAGEEGIVKDFATALKTTSSSEIKVTHPVSEAETKKYLGELSTLNAGALRRFTEDEEGRTLLINNEDNLDKVSFLPIAGLGTFATYYGWTVLAGTAPLSFIFTGPILGYYAWKGIQQYHNARVPAVSHVYSRGSEGNSVLDFVIQDNQEVTEVIENISADDVALLNDPETIVSYRNKEVTLADARAQGLSPIYDVISVKGNNYFICGAYSTNVSLLESTGIKA